ncbi:WD40 repeat domain-containing protein [Chloroflexi bacterium TSY]|nr:WD40 repeat domain-containing protein [Chloroflexi bacterium TSY]
MIVPPLNQAELREIIEGPAGGASSFDPPELIDQLIDEVIQTPGALPLLSFTLEQLYFKYLKRQEAAQAVGDTIERALTQEDYDDLGGVIGSLRTRADEEYDKLSDDAHRETMQRVMLRMVAVEGGELARRRVPLVELEYPKATENKRVKEIIDRLIEARLLVRDRTEAGSAEEAEVYVEPAHDALVRAWDRLLRWKQGFEEYLSLQRTLAAAADGWASEGSNAKSGLLWNNNPRLPQLQEILVPDARGNGNGNNFLRTVRQSLWPSTTVTEEPTWLNRRETEFVQTSVVRRANVLKRIVGITVAVVVALSGLTLYAFDRQQEAVTQTGLANQRLEAESTARADAEIQEEKAVQAAETAVAEASIARSRQLAAESLVQSQSGQHEFASLLAVESGIAADTSAAFSAIRRAVPESNQRRKVFYSPSGSVHHAKWNEDESRILATYATYAEAGAIVWDVETKAALFKFQDTNNCRARNIFPCFVAHAIWSKDESKILLSGNEGSLWVWDLNSQSSRAILQDYPLGFKHATWNNEETQILTVDDENTIRTWDALTGKAVSTKLNAQEVVDSKKWRLDQAISLSINKAVQSSVTNAMSMVESFMAATNVQRYVSHAEWSTDRSQILSLGNEISLWDVDAKEELLHIGLEQRSAGLGGAIWSAKLNRDGSQILSTGCDLVSDLGICGRGSVHIWSTENWREIRPLESMTESDQLVEWSPDGSKVFVQGGQTKADIWTIQTGEHVTLKTAGNKNFNYAKFSSDGTKMVTISYKDATSYQDEIAQIWDVNNGQELISYEYNNFIHPSDISTDASMFLAVGNDDNAYIMEALTGSTIAMVDLEKNIRQAIWNADESLILIIEDGGVARVWDFANNEEVFVLPKEDCDENLPDDCFFSYVFKWGNRESKILRADFSGSVSIWDVEKRAMKMALTTQPMGVEFIEWNNDDTRVLVGGCDAIDGMGNCIQENIIIIDASNGAEISTLQGPRIDAQWSPDGRYIFADGRVWMVQTGQALMDLTVRDRYISSAQWSIDGSKIFIVRQDGQIESFYIDMNDVVNAACKALPRNMTQYEWVDFTFESYRPTCPEAPIPPDAIEAVTNEARVFAQNGNLPAAAERLSQLILWLRQNGQFNTFGTERARWLAMLQGGWNPWAGE